MDPDPARGMRTLPVYPVQNGAGRLGVIAGMGLDHQSGLQMGQDGGADQAVFYFRKRPICYGNLDKARPDACLIDAVLPFMDPTRRDLLGGLSKCVCGT